MYGIICVTVITICAIISNWTKKHCNHHFVMSGRKARTIHTPMVCIYCGKIKNKKSEVVEHE